MKTLNNFFILSAGGNAEPQLGVVSSSKMGTPNPSSA